MVFRYKLEYLLIICPKCGRIHEVPGSVFKSRVALLCPYSRRYYLVSRAKVLSKLVTL